MASSSDRVKTWPVGLFGVFTTMPRVREVNAAASRSRSSSKRSDRPSVTRSMGTQTGFAPHRMASGP